MEWNCDMGTGDIRTGMVSGENRASSIHFKGGFSICFRSSRCTTRACSSPRFHISMNMAILGCTASYMLLREGRLKMATAVLQMHSTNPSYLRFRAVTRTPRQVVGNGQVISVVAS